MYLDPGNIFFLNLGEPEDWIKDIGINRICQVHLKDFARDENGRPVAKPLLKGELNWKGIMSLLRKINYKGWLGVEVDLPETEQKEFLSRTRQSIEEIL